MNLPSANMAALRNSDPLLIMLCIISKEPHHQAKRELRPIILAATLDTMRGVTSSAIFHLTQIVRGSLCDNR